MTTRWLTDDQQRVWRDWLRLNALLPAALHRELQADSDLSLQDFDVLVALTDTPEERLRVSELADALHWERSRLSHHVRRMERRGLVAARRAASTTAGAPTSCCPPRAGRRSTARRPRTCETVRELFVDALTAEELATLARITGKVLARLADRGDD